MKKRIQIQDINPLKESFKTPEGYFDLLLDKINSSKGDQNKEIKLEDIPKLEDSFQVPEGYFDTLADKLEERKHQENYTVKFRSTRIKILGGMVAAACVAMIMVSVVNFGGTNSENILANNAHEDSLSVRLKSIPDHEIALLLNDRDDEFNLTDDEIIEVIEHETKESESTAIIDFLEEEGTLDDEPETEDDEFIESI